MNQSQLANLIQKHATEIAGILLGGLAQQANSTGERSETGEEPVVPIEEKEIQELADSLGLMVTCKDGLYEAWTKKWTGKTNQHYVMAAASAAEMLAQLKSLGERPETTEWTQKELDTKIVNLASELGFEAHYDDDSNNYRVWDKRGGTFVTALLPGAKMLAELEKLKSKVEPHAFEIRELATELGMTVTYDIRTNNYTASRETGEDAFITFKFGGAEMLARLETMKKEADAKKAVADDGSKVHEIYTLANALGLTVHCRAEESLYKIWRHVGFAKDEENDLLLSATSADEMIEKLEAMATENLKS